MCAFIRWWSSDVVFFSDRDNGEEQLLEFIQMSTPLLMNPQANQTFKNEMKEKEAAAAANRRTLSIYFGHLVFWHLKWFFTKEALSICSLSAPSSSLYCTFGVFLSLLRISFHSLLLFCCSVWIKRRRHEHVYINFPGIFLSLFVCVCACICMRVSAAMFIDE